MPNIRLKGVTDFPKSRIVPRAGLSSDLFTYFNDTSEEAVVLAGQLEMLNSYRNVNINSYNL